MKLFKDRENRDWIVEINVATIKRCRNLLNIDLYGLVDDKFQGLAKLLADPVTLVDVLYVLCMEAAEKKNISDVDFGRAMHGDAILVATTAFYEELVDFFPDPRVRAGMMKVMKASKSLQDAVLERMDAELSQIDIEAEVRKLMKSSGITPASSESTPAPSPSPN